jgi:ribosomal protein L29
MKKEVKDLKNKTIKELIGEATKMRTELAKLTLSRKSNPGKDINSLAKKKKELARTLAVITEKETLEKVMNSK